MTSILRIIGPIAALVSIIIVAGCLVDIDGPEFKQYDQRFIEEATTKAPDGPVYVYLEQFPVTAAPDSAVIEIHTNEGLGDSLRFVLHVVGKTYTEQVDPEFDIIPSSDTIRVWYTLHVPWEHYHGSRKTAPPATLTSPPLNWIFVERFEIYKPADVEVIARNRFIR